MPSVYEEAHLYIDRSRSYHHRTPVQSFVNNILDVTGTCDTAYLTPLMQGGLPAIECNNGRKEMNIMPVSYGRMSQLQLDL